MGIHRERGLKGYLLIIVNSNCSGYLVPCNKLPQKLVMQNSNHFIVFVDSVHWEFIQDTAVMTRPSDGKASVVTAMSDASAEMAEG